MTRSFLDRSDRLSSSTIRRDGSQSVLSTTYSQDDDKASLDDTRSTLSDSGYSTSIYDDSSLNSFRDSRASLDITQSKTSDRAILMSGSQQSSVIQPLLTDLYQISMAFAYWKSGKHQEMATFDVYFRKNREFQSSTSIFLPNIHRTLDFCSLTQHSELNTLCLLASKSV